MTDSNLIKSDVCIIGTGIAGLTAALECAKKGLKVTVLSKSAIKESSTLYAQGGIAVAMDKDDAPQFHYEDTIKAGAGLCDAKMVKILVEEGPKHVQALLSYGAQFDQINGTLSYTKEAAHSKRRILHAGDATGREIEKTLGQRVLKEESVRFIDYCSATQLQVNSDGRCCRVLAEKKGVSLAVEANAILLATGGCAQVYKHNTNPAGATGDGIVLAKELGARLANMEFIQFHPTTLYIGDQKPISLFLISEAVRGEGGVLRNKEGERFMKNYHPDEELAPRDIVSRAIFSEMKHDHSDHVFLDFSSIKSSIPERFPTIYERCLAANINLETDWVPVAPAAHYMIGGIETNEWGETTVPGLYAAGEVASTGVHGANRLASNSLLEGLVFGARAATHIAETISSQNKAGGGIPNHLPLDNTYNPQLIKQSIRQQLWEHVGIVRNLDGLVRAESFLKDLPLAPLQSGRSMAEREALAMSQVAIEITQSALNREESVGAHCRVSQVA